MKPFIIDTGNKIVQSEECLKDPILFTQKLLQFKAQVDELVLYSFDNNIAFQKARDAAFMDFMNDCMQTAIYMAQYCDELMRKELKGKSQDEVHQMLDKVIGLFCCLHNRDQFMKAYEKELSTRLLNKTSISQEYEEFMIQKFKVECGAQQVAKMTSMVKDMQLSKDAVAEFVAHNQGRPDIEGVEFNIEILTNGNWPSFSDPPQLSPPKSIKTCINKFEMWYKNKNSNRQLTWMYQNGSIELQNTYTPKKYQFVLTLF